MEDTTVSLSDDTITSFRNKHVSIIGNGVDLTVSGNTIDSEFSGEWRIKSYDAAKPDVFVNGVEYTTIAIDGKTMTIDSDKNVTVNG